MKARNLGPFRSLIRLRMVLLLIALFALSSCTAGGSNPAGSPAVSNTSVAEPSGTAAATASPAVSVEPELVEPPETCLVSRLVPSSEFTPHTDPPVWYSGDNLVVTYVDGSLVWEIDGETGFIYENPGVTEDAKEFEEDDWNGSRLGTYFVSDGRFVVYDTMEVPYLGEPAQLHLWDAATPEQPPKQIASAPGGTTSGPMWPAIRGDLLLWNQPAPERDEQQVMLYDLDTGEKRLLIQGPYSRAGFVTDDLVVFVELAADRGGTLGGIYISTGERWQAPAALKEFHMWRGGFVSDGTTTAIAIDPLTGDLGGYGVAVWREGWSHAMTDESILHAFLDSSLYGNQLQGDLLAYLLTVEGGSSARVWNLSTGVIYEIRDEFTIPYFDGDELVLSGKVEGLPDGGTARIPLSEFETGECPD